MSDITERLRFQIGDKVIVDGHSDLIATVIDIILYGSPAHMLVDCTVQWWNNGSVQQQRFDEWRLSRAALGDQP